MTQTITPSEVEAVAAKLSEDERWEILATAPDTPRRYGAVTTGTRKWLFRHQLVRFVEVKPYDGKGWQFGLTPLGLAVRAHLKDHTNVG